MGYKHLGDHGSHIAYLDTYSDTSIEVDKNRSWRQKGEYFGLGTVS